MRVLLLALVALHVACSFLVRNVPNKMRLQRYYMEIPEYGDDDTLEAKDTLTDEEKGLTNGYEGDFKVGDKVRVTKAVRIWSVKKYMEEGFEVQGFCGVVSSLALYGRKKKSLCSAITPIRVEITPDSPGVPPGMFDKKFILHFAADELEHIQ